MEERRDLDTLMGHLGEFGKYQGFQFTLHVLSAILAGIHMLSLVTVAAIPEHRCLIPEKETPPTANYFTLLNDSRIPKLPSGEIDPCHLLRQNNSRIKCTVFVYDTTYYGTTRAVEWNLVCDRRWIGATAQSAFMFGVFAGCVTLGIAADKYGRKIIFCWSALAQLIVGIAVAFTPEIYSFIILRFILGIVGSAGCYITGFVLTMELVKPFLRTMFGFFYTITFACGILVVAGWAAIIRDPKYLQITYGVHAIVLTGHWWLMDESPRWLWSQGRVQESIGIINRALKINNSTVHINESEYVTRIVVEKITGVNVCAIFKSPNLRKKSLNMSFCWFANSLLYYGLSLNTGNLGGNPFILLFLTGAVEIPCYIISISIVDRTGRRLLISVNMILGSVCCIIATLLTVGDPATIAVVMTGKFLIASSFAIVYIFAAEMFPTVVRNSAIGFFSMCARLAGAFTPFISLLDSFQPKLPADLFAGVALVSGVFTLFLPETLGKAMPETIADGEVFGVGDTCFSKIKKRKASVRTADTNI